MVEQRGVVDVLTLLLGGGELAFEVFAEGAQLGSPLVDVPDEVRVEVVGDLQGADQAAVLGAGVGDGLLQGLDLARVLFPGFAGGGRLTGVEQAVAVGVEDVVRQEPDQAAEQVIFPDPRGDLVPGGRYAFFGLHM